MTPESGGKMESGTGGESSPSQDVILA